MKENKKTYVLVEGLSINDLHRMYNRDRDKIQTTVKKLAGARIKALRQRFITKDGLTSIQATVKSGQGNWEYNLVIKVNPEKQSYRWHSFTVIDDPTRPRKKQVLWWDMIHIDDGGKFWCSLFVKQHALERYYQRSRKEDFPGIKEAMNYIFLNEMTFVDGDCCSAIKIYNGNISLSVRTGQFLAYTYTDSFILDRTKPILINTFVGNDEIDKRGEFYQFRNRTRQEDLISGEDAW